MQNIYHNIQSKQSKFLFRFQFFSHVHKLIMIEKRIEACVTFDDILCRRSFLRRSPVDSSHPKKSENERKAESLVFLGAAFLKREYQPTKREGERVARGTWTGCDRFFSLLQHRILLACVRQIMFEIIDSPCPTLSLVTFSVPFREIWKFSIANRTSQRSDKSRAINRCFVTSCVDHLRNRVATRPPINQPVIFDEKSIKPSGVA